MIVWLDSVFRLTQRFVARIVKKFVREQERDLRQWKQLNERIREQDFEDLIYDTEVKRVPNELLNKIISFVDDLEQDRERIRFSKATDQALETPKRELVSAYYAYREFICVPYWDHKSDERGSAWVLDKWHFEENGFDYPQHLDLAREQAANMKKAFRSMYDVIHLR